ncbi:hypothetical protein F7734_48275 [Scytonema sp. UIC 10036]|uniref:hypothetical protein n=1 Tax=Scytonema sp. UIC 10036 TaxID=2304196 RepID=UPI0012DAC317|nr:hypothetical protein [Scytonema sp. UIC 10036]MUG99668.1 hypothetical protein [Scytonema sp. UIC 10036]
MMFFNQFIKILENVSTEVLESANQNNKLTFIYIFSYAIQSWSKKLNVSDDALVSITQFSNEIPYLTNELWHRWKDYQNTFFGLNNEESNFKIYINKIIGNRMLNINLDDIKFIVIIAFIITAI